MPKQEVPSRAVSCRLTLITHMLTSIALSISSVTPKWRYTFTREHLYTDANIITVVLLGTSSLGGNSSLICDALRSYRATTNIIHTWSLYPPLVNVSAINPYYLPRFTKMRFSVALAFSEVFCLVTIFCPNVRATAFPSTVVQREAAGGLKN